MKKFLTLWLYGTLIALTPAIVQPDPIACTDEANPDIYDETVTVAVGDQFTITLNANPSTGYIWQLSTELDASFIKLLSKKSTPINPSLMGTPIVETWTFLALAEGTIQISFMYKRPWENKSDGEKEYTLTITIKKGTLQ